MFLFSLKMELVYVMSATVLLVNSLPLTGLPRKWISGADDSQPDVSNPSYDSLSRDFAPKAHQSLGSKDLYRPFHPIDNSYRVPREFDSLKDNFVDISKPLTKRQQGWYNKYGKRGFEPLSPASKLWSASYYMDPQLMPRIHNPSERRTYHQETDQLLNPKTDHHAFGMQSQSSAGRKNSSVNDRSHMMTQELAAIQQKLRELFRTVSGDDVISRQEDHEIFRDVDSTQWLENFNRVGEFENS